MPGGEASATFLTKLLMELILTYPSDFTALTDGKKLQVGMIISCGAIDMQVGSICRTTLMESIFPSGDIFDGLTELLAYTPPPPP